MEAMEFNAWVHVCRINSVVLELPLVQMCDRIIQMIAPLLSQKRKVDLVCYKHYLL